MALVDDGRATVWLEGGVPYGLVWAGRHYRVTDSPTQLDGQDAAASGTAGWRFQGTDDDDQSLVFDIVRQASRWRVSQVYA